MVINHTKNNYFISAIFTIVNVSIGCVPKIGSKLDWFGKLIWSFWRKTTKEKVKVRYFINLKKL
jgi:hypothetical protein